MAAIVIDLVRVGACGQELDRLLSYEIEVAWRRSPCAVPCAPSVPGDLAAILIGCAEPVAVSIGRVGAPDLAFTLAAGERRTVAVRAGQRIDVLPANVVRLAPPRTVLRASPVARPATARGGPAPRRVPPP